MSAAVYCVVRNLRDMNNIKTITDKSITVDAYGNGETVLSFDQVFASGDQGLIFTSAKPLIQKATEMQRSGTIAVYGASSSGKSYTLTGAERRISANENGLVPRTLKYIEAMGDNDVLTEISFVEIGVDNAISDLLEKSQKFRSHISRPAKVSIRDTFDGCILFEKATRIRHDRHQPHLLEACYLQGLARLEQRGAKNTLASCFQVTFTRKQSAKRSTLRFVEVHPRGRATLEHCWRMKMHNAAKYRQSALTQFMRSSIEGSENLALFFCCGRESSKDLVEFASLAQCVYADRSSPRESDVGSSKMTESAASSGRQDESIVLDLLDRKRDFIHVVKKDMHENDVAIQEINTQLLARRQPSCQESTRLLETELRRMLTNVTKTRSIQEETLAHLHLEMDALTQIHKLSCLRSAVRTDKVRFDKNEKTTATAEDLQPPEHAPEAVVDCFYSSSVSDHIPSNPSIRSNASSAVFRGCLIPTLPLDMIPKQEDPPGKKPYIEAPRDPRRRRSESSDSGTGSPVSDVMCSPMNAYNPSPFFRPFFGATKVARATLPASRDFSQATTQVPETSTLPDAGISHGKINSADAAIEEPRTYHPTPYRLTSASKPSLAVPHNAAQPRLNASASHASLHVDRLCLNSSNSQASLMPSDGIPKRLFTSPFRLNPYQTPSLLAPNMDRMRWNASPLPGSGPLHLRKSFSCAQDVHGFAPCNGGDAPDYRMNTSGSMAIAPPRFCKSPSVKNLRPMSPLPWAFDCSRQDGRTSSVLPVTGVPECGRQTPSLYAFQPAGRPVTIAGMESPMV